MRCIEIILYFPLIQTGNRLTLTWDVLKFPIKFRMADDEGD